MAYKYVMGGGQSYAPLFLAAQRAPAPAPATLVLSPPSRRHQQMGRVSCVAPRTSGTSTETVEAMTSEQGTITNYMELKPQEGSVFDLFHLLFSKNIERNHLVSAPKGTKQPQLKGRWIMIISIVLQKIVLAGNETNVWMGTNIENFLNLLSWNGGFLGLLLRSLVWRVKKPDRNSGKFIGFAGFIDKRRSLDKDIKRSDSRYTLALSMMASKLVYEYAPCVESVVKDDWGMEFIGFYKFWNDYQEQYSTPAFMFCDNKNNPELFVISFRGTPAFDAYALATDVDVSWFEIPSFGKFHGGFMKALGLQKKYNGFPKNLEQGDNPREVAYYYLREKLKKLLQDNPKAKFVLTGHSLGGALAILFPTILCLHQETELLERLDGVYTYGQPRVGDEKLGELMKHKLSLYGIKYYRMVYCNDLVPRLPADDTNFYFKHFGTCVYYNSFYKGRVVSEEPNKNYFSLIWTIPMLLNAVYEFIRSFIIRYTRGPEFAEGGLMKLFRVIGLLIPGLSAHCPTDYINLTRIAPTFPPS